MKESRRSVLKIAGVSALGLSAASNAHAIGEYLIPSGQARKEQKDSHADRWGMVIDTRKLNHDINKKMMEACHVTHNVPNLPEKYKKQEIKWAWEEEYGHAFTEIHNELDRKRTRLNSSHPYRARMPPSA